MILDLHLHSELSDDSRAPVALNLYLGLLKMRNDDRTAARRSTDAVR